MQYNFNTKSDKYVSTILVSNTLILFIFQFRIKEEYEIHDQFIFR